ncbi:MAG: hypothetical protein AAF696_34660 [Bacteroidota bacterium]
MKKVLGNIILIGGLVMGTMIMTSSSSDARIIGKKDREVVGASCIGAGSCAVVINGNTHTENKALDRVIYN